MILGCVTPMQHLMLMVSSGVPLPTAREGGAARLTACGDRELGLLPNWTTRNDPVSSFPPIGGGQLPQGDGSRRARPYRWHKHADPDRLANMW